MDSVSAAILWFFVSLFGAALLGAIIGRFTTFAIGMAAGLLIPGALSATYSMQFFLDYRAFTAPAPNKVMGEVIAIEYRPVNESGSITQPTPVIRYTSPENAVHTIRGPGAASYKVGEKVTVLYDPENPERARIADVGELKGAAIGFMLFGTFPLSAGILFLFDAISEVLEKRNPRRPLHAPAPITVSPYRQRLMRELNWGFNLAMLGGILWVAYAPTAIERAFMLGFAIVACGLLGHAIKGLWDPAVSAQWSLGMFVVGANFGAFSVALWLLA
jgi:hypothetical protein